MLSSYQFCSALAGNEEGRKGGLGLVVGGGGGVERGRTAAFRASVYPTMF